MKAATTHLVACAAALSLLLRPASCFGVAFRAVPGFSPSPSLSLGSNRQLAAAASNFAGVKTLPLSSSVRGRRIGALGGLRAQLMPGDTRPVEEETKQVPLDWEGIQKQFSTFARIAAPYFREEKTAKVLIVVVVALVLVNSAVSVQFSYLSRDFWTALNQKNPEEFQAVLTRFSLALLAGVPISVSYKYYRDKLALQWRNWLSQRVLDMFQADRSYYLLEARKEVDNPDQRVAEDVRSFTTVSLSFSITLLKSAVDLASFSTILLSIYPQLFGAIILYAGFGTACTVAIGKQLVGINFEQLQREADFRFSLMRMRENAESIAFYGGEDLEMGEIKRRLDRSVNNFWSLIRAQRNLEFFTVAYSYMVQIIPGLVISPLFFAGKIELGVVSQSYGAFNHILGDLSIIVNQFEGISSFSAGIDRLGTFVDKMEESRLRQVSVREEAMLADGVNATMAEEESWLDAIKVAIGFSDNLGNPPSPLESGAELLKRIGQEVLPFSKAQEMAFDMQEKVREASEKEGGNLHGAAAAACPIGEIRSSVEPGAVLNVEDLTLVTPDCTRTLIEGLNLKMDEGQHLLIVGNSGAGKSSLLRAVAGLWTAGSGFITRPPPGETFFLPQRYSPPRPTPNSRILTPSVNHSFSP